MSRGSSRFQVKSDIYSYDLTLEQKTEMIKILDIISLHMIVDRNILDNVNAKNNSDPTGLSYIKKAIKRDWIVEIKSKDAERKDCFYLLGMAGISLLENDGSKFNLFKLRDSQKEMNKVLMFNYYLLSKNYDLLFSKLNDFKNYNFFYCLDKDKRNIILYYKDEIAQNTIISILKDRFLSNLDEEERLIALLKFDKFINSVVFESIEIVETSLKCSARTTLFDEIK